MMDTVNPFYNCSFIYYLQQATVILAEVVCCKRAGWAEAVSLG